MTTMETDYFDTFCKISKAFGSAATQNELLNLIVDSAISTMDGKAACLFLSDEKNDFFIPVVQKGLSENYFHASPIKVVNLIKEIEKKGYLLFKDATTDARLEHHEAKKAEGIASIMSVPVRMKNHTIGILSLYTATQRDFGEKEISFLCALADQGGIAIHNNRLLNRIEKNSTLFLDLASSINSTLEITEILKHMTEELCDVFGMKGASIRLFNEDTQAMELVASHGLTQEFLKSLAPNVSSDFISSILKGETKIVNDTDIDKRPELVEGMKKAGIKSAICTPIMAREQAIGLMGLFSEDQREFPNDLIMIVEALGHQGGLAIQNASMYLKLQEDKNNLEKDVWSHRSWF
ncbi:MAG: GAF domain-containing protein [Desulfamplus sp.]|nr:GAF domain-containing protein [Desulfamplus sp.]